jgi:formate/nitrite transporter FocA (FNT family)
MKKRVTLGDLWKILLSGIASGMVILAATLAYININDKILGAFIFAFGLILITFSDLALFTRVNPIYKRNVYLDQLSHDDGRMCASVSMIGNAIGVVIPIIIILLHHKIMMSTSFQHSLDTKIILSWSNVFFRIMSAFFCGTLIAIPSMVAFQMAEDDETKNISQVIKLILMMFMAIFLFVYNGFDHVVVSLAYIFLMHFDNSNVILSIIYRICLIFIIYEGNKAGGCFVEYVMRKKIHK